jgi:hypothetical protein
MKKTDRLYYFGTETEILAGDHVVLKGFFTGRPKSGRVSYIPEKTAKKLAEEKKDSDDWLIELSDGTVTGWLYSPEDLPASKRLKFVSRKNDNYKGTNSDELEVLEEDLMNHNNPILFGIISIIIIVLMCATVILLFRTCGG